MLAWVICCLPRRMYWFTSLIAAIAPIQMQACMWGRVFAGRIRKRRLRVPAVISIHRRETVSSSGVFFLGVR